MIDVICMKGGGTPPPPSPPPAPADSAKRVDRTLVEGRRKRLGYTASLLGGSTDKGGSLLGG